jgi:membrane protein
MATQTPLQSRVWNVVELFRDRFRKHDVLTYASGIAFQALKSLIPLTLLGLGILGALGRRDIWTEHIAPALQPRFDRPIYRAIDFAAEQIFAGNSAGVIAFSAALTVWYVSSVVRGVMGAINRIYETDEERPLWLRWAISIGLAVCVVTAIVGAALLVLAVPNPAGAWEIPVGIVRWLGAIVMLTVAAALLVRLGPAKRRPARWVTAGAVLVIVTWLVTSALFRWYVASLANFKTAVGELTVFIVLMLYAYASSIVLLVGIEVDELLRAEARAERQRGILGVLFGIGR